MKNTITTIILGIAVLFIGFALAFHIWTTEQKREQSAEVPVKCIRSDIGAIVRIDGTELSAIMDSSQQEYVYTASYTCQDSAVTSIFMFAKEWEDMDYFGPWVVVITDTPDYRMEERVFCTKYYSGYEQLSVNKRNNYSREHTWHKYSDHECGVGQHNLVAEFKNKWKL